jgi:outer membrane protein
MFSFQPKPKNMLLKKNRILPALLLLCFLQAAGQEKFSLEQLIKLTLEENYQLKIMSNQQRMAENLNTPGNAGKLPAAGLGADYTRDIQTSEANLYTGAVRSGDNALSTRFNAFVDLNWNVFDGFSMFARHDRLGLLAEMGELETRYFLEQTIADLAKTYYLLIRERRRLELYVQSKELSAYRLMIEEQKRTLGSGNPLLYHQAVIDFNADTASEIHQQINIRDQEIQLNRIINRNPRLRLFPENEMISLQGIAAQEEVISLSVVNNRDMERARLEEMIAEADHRIEKGGRYPQVNLFGSYAFNRQTSELGLLESSQSRGPQFGVRVRFNLYDGGRQNTQIKNAILAQESQNIDQADTRAFVEAELIRLTGRYNAMQQEVQLLQNSIEAAERSLTIAREQLQTGAINGYEFRQTQMNALFVENQLIDLKYSMRLIEIDIYRISGVLMEKLFAEE